MNKLNSVTSAETLAEFILALKLDWELNEPEWENRELPVFLEAASAWVEDMDGYYTNQGKELNKENKWRVFADILYAAKMYE
jgi:hypothetical protein